MDDIPEFRRDPITRRWSIVAKNRSLRPNDFSTGGEESTCPFCPGSEDETPSEVFAIRPEGSTDNGPEWTVRVVPNKFPALAPHGDLSGPATPLFDRLPGVGVHEVIIESPRHIAGTSQLTDDEVRQVFEVYRHRLRVLREQSDLKYGLIFKNVGEAAGASLEHTHSQLMAMPLVPDAVQRKIDHAREYHRQQARCVYCDMVEQELRDRVRLVFETERFAAFCPYAGRFPYETWVVPKEHADRFEDCTLSASGELAIVVKRVVERLDAVLDRPAYNYLLHTAPFDSLTAEHYHWHVEIMPSLTRAAGFEWATGIHINPTAPEDAAMRLSRAIL